MGNNTTRISEHNIHYNEDMLIVDIQNRSHIYVNTTTSAREYGCGDNKVWVEAGFYGVSGGKTFDQIFIFEHATQP